MKSWVLLFVLTLSTGLFCQEQPETLATEAANHWLTMIDEGDYAGSWDAAAPAFKNAVSKQQWIQAMKANRAPLGKVLSRNVKSAVYATSLPGAPDGHYVVIQYDSSFTHKQLTVETVTPSQDEDGQWRVSGYYIH